KQISATFSFRDSSKDRNLFASAVNPISIVFYTNNRPTKPSEKLMYCAPKTAIKNKIIDGIAIDPTDIKYLPREECEKSDTKIWKIAMWGTEKDYKIINLLKSVPTIDDTIKNNLTLKKGGGFQTSNPKYDLSDSPILEKIPYIEAAKVERYYSKKENTIEEIPFTKFERLGTKTSYLSPHLLLKTGQSQKKFCASFLDYDCSFTKTIYGIHSTTNDTNYLKVLAGFLNSNLATYILFLSSASWGVEREEVKPNETLSLPDINLILNEKGKEILIRSIDEIIEIIDGSTLNEKKSILHLEQQIENVLMKGFDFTNTQNILIQDLLDYKLDAFQNKQKSIAYNPTNINDRQQYAEFLCKTMNQYVDYDKELSVWANVFELSPRIPLNVTILYFNQKKQADEIITLPEKQIGQILKQMEKYSYDAHSESIYYRRFFRYYADDKLYIIKPNEKRFWSRSMAINDASEITAEILNSK
ncbi:MAG: hypothetical protein AAFP82_16645, partial [Bacteroidota bacterium]